MIQVKGLDGTSGINRVLYRQCIQQIRKAANSLHLLWPRHDYRGSRVVRLATSEYVDLEQKGPPRREAQ